jgi:hypothetical protein
VSAFGAKGVAEIAYLVGCYTTICSICNVFDVDLTGTEEGWAMIVPAGPSKSAETHIERKFPMITIKRLNHVGIRALDPARSAAFYVGVLGLEPHPTKKNWLRTKDKEFSVHLMPGTERSPDGNDAADLARHFALESDDLEGVVDGLLAAGYKPFQSDLKAEHRKELTDSRDLTSPSALARFSSSTRTKILSSSWIGRVASSRKCLAKFRSHTKSSGQDRVVWSFAGGGELIAAVTEVACLLQIRPCRDTCWFTP